VPRQNAMGASGLAFETWDPWNKFPMETPPPLFHSEVSVHPNLARPIQIFDWESIDLWSEAACI
jgi:hypothetical protein